MSGKFTRWESSMDVGVVVGRFQVDDLHEGHKSLLEFARKRHPNLIVFIGIAPFEGTKNNPLSYQLREQMIREHCPKATILPIFDVLDDGLWSAQLDSLIKRLYYGSTATLYCGRDSFESHYSGEFQVVVQTFKEKHSGTDVREMIGDSPDHQASFRAGVIHQTQKLFMTVKMCVDIAVTREAAMTGEKEILLGHKQAEQNREVGKLWRLPGGQVDASDETLEFAAKRELYEETDVLCEGKMLYLASFLVGDWRNTGTGLSTFTALFECEATTGGVKAKDDLDELKWFPIDKDTIKLIVSEHVPLFWKLINVHKESK